MRAPSCITAKASSALIGGRAILAMTNSQGQDGNMTDNGTNYINQFRTLMALPPSH
jgi:hypothetical protein